MNFLSNLISFLIILVSSGNSSLDLYSPGKSGNKLVKGAIKWGTLPETWAFNNAAVFSTTSQEIDRRVFLNKGLGDCVSSSNHGFTCWAMLCHASYARAMPCCGLRRLLGVDWHSRVNNRQSLHVFIEFFQCGFYIKYPFTLCYFCGFTGRENSCRYLSLESSFILLGRQPMDGSYHFFLPPFLREFVNVTFHRLDRVFCPAQRTPGGGFTGCWRVKSAVAFPFAGY